MKTFTPANVHDCARIMESYFRQNGPLPYQYEALNQLLHEWHQLRGQNRQKCRELEQLWTTREAVFEPAASNIGHAYHKPYGYAGDFEVIDRLYQYHINGQDHLRRWDEFFQQQPGGVAVRNRKAWFLERMVEYRKQKSAGMRLLNLASGPARDLFEAFLTAPSYPLQCDCVEQDPRAIAYARKVLGSFVERVSFIQRNVLRYQPEKKYDLIWSAGLFDYFSDKAFAMVLGNALQWLKPGGEIIIGNFSKQNPSKAFMETFLDWHLHHRSEGELIKLAHQAGVTREYNLQVDAEPLGVNLFLRVKRPR